MIRRQGCIVCRQHHEGQQRCRISWGSSLENAGQTFTHNRRQIFGTVSRSTKACISVALAGSVSFLMPGAHGFDRSEKVNHTCSWETLLYTTEQSVFKGVGDNVEKFLKVRAQTSGQCDERYNTSLLFSFLISTIRINLDFPVNAQLFLDLQQRWWAIQITQSVNQEIVKNLRITQALRSSTTHAINFVFNPGYYVYFYSEFEKKLSLNNFGWGSVLSVLKKFFKHRSAQFVSVQLTKR